MAEATRELGWEDYLQSPDDGNRHEIVDGEWVVTPPPTKRHQWILGRLFLKVGNFLEGQDELEAYFAPCAVALGGPNYVEPDLFVVPRDGSVEFGEQRLKGAPLLVAEILSPGTRRYDLVRKRRLYERAGVREYWVVDPEDESVSVFHRSSSAGAGFEAPVKTFADAEGRVESRVLAGLELAVADLFRR